MDNSYGKSTIEDGVRILYNHSIAEDEKTKQSLISLIEDAVRLGCIDALKKHNHNVEYLLDPRRTRYLSLVNFQETDDVLEIGSSLGQRQHTRLIAGKCKSLSALEIVPLQAKFSRIWCDEERLTNVEITAGGATGQLPYADKSFDWVICNYVLEWCAGRSDKEPEEFHRDFLSEIFRVIRPSGRLLIATKNRFSLRYVTGSFDEHLGIRFGNALPRPIQKIVRKHANIGHPPGYLHSWAGLECMLGKAGFTSMERFLAFPDNRYADYVGSFDNFSKNSLSRKAIAKLSKKNKLALLLNRTLLQFFSNSLVFLAKK